MMAAVQTSELIRFICFLPDYASCSGQLEQVP